MNVMQISILDQSPTRSGHAPDAAIRETLALAQLADELGYHRYWLSEHHSHEAVAGTAPEILAAAIAATTRRIRIGSAGIMLPHYATLKVAEQFRVLEAIAPGRIDLGLGRAPGTDGRSAFALNPNYAKAADEFPQQVRELQAWVAGRGFPALHPYRGVFAAPAGPHLPEIWILGSSNFGAQLAAHFGLPYCFAYFFADGAGAAEALHLYRTHFRPSEFCAAPHSAVTVWAFAAETDERADYFYQSRALMRLYRERGKFIPEPAPEEAAAYEMSEFERARAAEAKAQAFLGTAPRVATRLRDLAAELQLDELAIVSTAYDPQARRDSYRLLAREFRLG